MKITVVYDEDEFWPYTELNPNLKEIETIGLSRICSKVFAIVV